MLLMCAVPSYIMACMLHIISKMVIAEGFQGK